MSNGPQDQLDKLADQLNSEESDQPITSENEWLLSGVDFDSRRIHLNQKVDASMASIIFRSLIKMSEISKDPIEIYLSTEGGSVMEGFNIYDAITSCPCEIIMYASGVIYSSGLLVYLAADKRDAAVNTRFMAHAISYGTETQKTPVHKVDLIEAEFNTKQFIKILTKKTKKSEKFWSDKLQFKDNYFGLDEAKAMGVVNSPLVKKGKSNGRIKK